MLTGAWAAAWLVGVALLASAAIRANAQYHERDLDADLALYAMAVYGLAWIDEDGRFHRELVDREPLLQESPFEIWAIEPGSKPTLHLAPDDPSLEIDMLGDVAARVVAAADDGLWLDGEDATGRRYRIHAIPSFDDSDEARLAILVAGDLEPSMAAQQGFVRGIGVSSILVALLGIGIGAALARRSLAPLAAAYDERERFLGGAAHELRRPAASLRAICESAASGDEPADRALSRIYPVVRETGDIVESLLLYARLDSDRPRLEPTDVRLDLLAETCVPEDGAVELRAAPSVAVADPTLLRIAVGNLLSNADRHARRAEPGARVRLTVDADGIEVEDAGPGFDDEVRSHATEPFVSSRRSSGVGLGLALVRRIAELHGGSLEIGAGELGGARVRIRLAGIRLGQA